MTPRLNRRELLKLAGASVFATGGFSGGANAQSEESEVIETDLVRVAVPTMAQGSQRFVEELARDGDVHAREIRPALRDQTGDTLNTTEVVGVDRSGNTVEVDRHLETSASTLDSTLTVTVPEEVPGAVIEYTVENVGDDTVELNTPDNFIGTDIGLGQAELASPGDTYRFSVQGGDPIAYDEVGRWETFDLPDLRAWVTSFDDERAITYGLDGSPSASDPLLAMTGNSPVDKIRLFGTAVTLEPGESATWRTAAVAHDGGSGAPARGGDLVDAAFGDGADQALVYAGSGDGLLYARTVATGEEAWTFESDGAGSYAMHSSPTVVDGTVYVGTDRPEEDGRLYAVDAATGEQEWRFTGLGPGGFLTPSPTVIDGSVYTGGANGLFSIDAATGNPEWEYDEISIEESSPTVVDGTAYVGTEGGELYAVDATTGNVAWQYPVPADDIESSPTAANGTVYVGTDGGTLHAVDAATGTQEWEFTSPTDSIESSPTISEEVVYIAAEDATLYAVDAAAGTELWRFGLDGATEATSPTVSEGVIYQATAKTLHAVDGNGTEQWHYGDIAGPTSSPTVYDGTVFVGSGGSDNPNDGLIVALDAETGDVEWTTDDPALFVVSSPTVVTDPESGRSVDSRVALRTLGHHGPPDDGDEQNATVSGVVRDAQSGDPLPGVTVRFARANTNQEFTIETADGTQGSAPGEYSIALPVDGETDYEIIVDPDGYQRFTDTITLSPGDNLNEEIELTALSSETATVSGFVREASTEDPLTGVTVRFTRADTGQEFTVATAVGDGGDAPGEYSIDLPVAGATDYEIIVDPDGYQRFTDTITLSPGDSVPKTIILRSSGADETLVVDETAEEDDPEYQTIQAALEDAEEGDTIEVLAGTYEGPVLLDKTVTVTTEEEAVVETGFEEGVTQINPGAFVIDADDAETRDVEPTIQGFRITGEEGIDARPLQFNGTTGDWTVKQLTFDDGSGGSDLIDASGTEGNWTINGVEVSIDDQSPISTVDAARSTGNWQVTSSTLVGSTAVNAKETSGDWSITGPGEVDAANIGVNASDAEGIWQIHRMNFLEMTGDDVVHIRASNVTNPPGNARRNFFEGTDPVVGGIGDTDVLTGNRLAAPASPDATGVSVTVDNAIDGENECDPGEPLCEPAGDGILQPDATVYLFDTSVVSVGPDGDIRDNRADSLTDLLEVLDGQELVFNDDVPAAATRAVETGPQGLVRYNGLDPEAEYCLLVTPPGESSGNVWSTCPAIENGTVAEESVTLTDTTHFGYLRDDPFGMEVTDKWGGTIRDDTNTLRKTSEWLDRHRRERIELLREANREAEVVSKPFEQGDAAKNTLIEGGGQIVDEILEYDGDPEDLVSVPNFVKDVIKGVAIDWIVEKLRSHIAGWGTRRLQQVSEQRADQFAERYDGYADELDKSWITRPHLNEPEGYDELETVVDAGDRIAATPDDIDVLRESIPPADLNHQHVRDVFRQFYIRVRDVSLSYTLADNSDEAPELPPPPTSSLTPDLNVDPGLGGLLSRTPGSPPDTLFMPDGTVYNTVKGGEAYPKLQTVATELRTPDPSDVLGDLFSKISTAGQALILLGVTSKAGVAVVAFAEAGETAATLVSEVEDAAQEWALAGFYMTLQLDTLHDIEALALAYEAHLDWLSDQLADPITGTVRGELTTGQLPIAIPGEEDIVEDEFRVTAENTGEETVPIRVFGYVLFEATRTVEREFTDEEYTVTLPDNQSFQTTEPDIGQGPVELSPGDQFATDMRYVFQIPDDRPLSSSTFRYVTELYMGGKRVDRRRNPVEIITDSQAVATQTPVSAADLAEVSARYVAEDLSSPVTKTDHTLDQYRTETETLLDTRVEPGQSETITTTVPADVAFAKLSLLGGPETAAELTVDTGDGTATSQNGSVALPTDVGEVTLTVRASAVRSGPVPVTLSLITVPQRPAILGTIPATLTGTPELGTTFVPKFELAEVGAQEPVDGIFVGSLALTNQAGTELPTEPEVSTGNESLPAGERQDVDITIDLPSSFDLSGESTRFSGEMTVSSDNAGSLAVPVSVLLLDTPIESATLTDADIGVTAARVSPAEVTVIPPVPGAEIQSVYDVTVEGEGEVSLDLPESLANEDLDAVRLVDDEYESVTYVGGTESTSFTLPAGSYPLVIVEQSGPPALPGQDNPPQDLDGDGLYEDVTGDGEFTIADIQAFFQHRDSPEVQNNAEFFNFAGDEPPDVSIGDVQALFERLVR